MRLSTAAVADGSYATAINTSTTTKAYTAWAYWPGAEKVSASAYALQWTTDAAAPYLPTAYTGFGQTDAEITSGVPQTVDIALNPVGASNVTVAAHVPAGYDEPSTTLGVVLGQAAITVLSYAKAGSSYSVLVPQVGSVKLMLQANNSRDGYSIQQVVNPSANVEVSLPVAPRILTPVNDANNVDGRTEFTWSPLVGGTYLVQFSPDGSGPTYVIVTNATTVRLPSYPRLGLSIPSDEFYYSSVEAVGPSTSVEDAGALMKAYWDGSRSLFVGGSDVRYFTTAGAGQIRAKTTVANKGTQRPEKFPRALKR